MSYGIGSTHRLWCTGQRARFEVKPGYKPSYTIYSLVTVAELLSFSDAVTSSVKWGILVQKPLCNLAELISILKAKLNISEIIQVIFPLRISDGVKKKASWNLINSSLHQSFIWSYKNWRHEGRIIVKFQCIFIICIPEKHIIITSYWYFLFVQN